MNHSKNTCPSCGDPLGSTRYSVRASGICINRSCGQFKQRREWKLNLMEFLDLAPYTKQQFLSLPNDTPIWLEYRWSLPGFCCESDILLFQHNGCAEFSMNEDLPIDTYGKQWRAWPTFKTFRPDQFDLEHHPW